eukprot:1153163-Pelagomonas_calceolata.AAC.2
MEGYQYQSGVTFKASLEKMRLEKHRQGSRFSSHDLLVHNAFASLVQNPLSEWPQHRKFVCIVHYVVGANDPKL